MFKSLEAARAKRANGEGGFTLIELLVVVVIIGVLVAIAIPLYLNYRKGAQNKSLESDVRAAVSTVEQCIGENNNLPPATATGSGTAGTDLGFSCVSGVAPSTTTVPETAKVGSSNTLTYTLIPAAAASGSGASAKPATPASYTIAGTNGNETVTYKSADSSTTKS